MLLDLAGIDKNERTMIQASIGNSRQFDKVADALVVQHPRIHFKEKGKQAFVPREGKGMGKGKDAFFNMRSFFKGNKGGGKGFQRRAHLADEEYPDYEEAAFMMEEKPYSNPAHWSEDEEEDYAYAAGEEWYDEPPDLHVAANAALEHIVEDQAEALELDCIACLHERFGDELMDSPHASSEFCQNAHTAFLGTKGSFQRQGKGKGFKGKYPVRLSNLSIEDRRKMLEKLKEKSECRDCSKKGHWRGDKQCTVKKSAHLALKSSSSSYTGVTNSSSSHTGVKLESIPEGKDEPPEMVCSSPSEIGN